MQAQEPGFKVLFWEKPGGLLLPALPGPTCPETRRPSPCSQGRQGASLVCAEAVAAAVPGRRALGTLFPTRSWERHKPAMPAGAFTRLALGLR